jgi:pyridoxal 5'-phosphate synthase pdxT subunit
MQTVGILALQGAVEPHARSLAGAGLRPVSVRDADELDAVDGLVLPGGESSTMLRLLERFGLEQPLDRFVRAGRPVLATCAGLILAARRVEQPAQRSFGWLDVAVARNAWGRQLESFEGLDDAGELALVFIRAPRILEVGPAVEVLATLAGEPVLVRQGAVLGAAFHPELTPDHLLYRLAFGPRPAAASRTQPAGCPLAGRDVWMRISTAHQR